MNESRANLFQCLFEFLPRDGHTPRENFLSEAFAYVLRTSKGACDAWVSLALKRQVCCEWFEVDTRKTEHDEDDCSLIPDMQVHGTLAGGESFMIVSEHKWDSACDVKQLSRYVKFAQEKKAKLTFIGGTRRQKREAANSDPALSQACFLWEDVFLALKGVPQKSGMLEELMDFMEAKGLSPGEPLSIERMKAFLHSAGFIDSLMRVTEKLQNNFEWKYIPSRYQNQKRNVKPRFGRVAVVFETPDWKPTITAGFLYDVRDHKVSFVGEGIDLLLRIEAAPETQTRIEPALDVLRRKRRELKDLGATVLLRGEAGNGNVHSLLIACSCLADLIASATTEDEQVNRIHQKLESWIKVLFADGELESAFKKAGLDSGMGNR